MTGADAYRAWPSTVYAALYGPRERIRPEDAMACFLPADAQATAVQMAMPHSPRHARWLDEWRTARESE